MLTAIKDVPIEAHALRAYVAALDPLDQKGERHVEIVGEVVAIPDACNSITLTAHRQNFGVAAGRAIKCRAEISLDGGETWPWAVGFGADGGLSLGPDGQPRTKISVTTNGLPAATGRLLRTVLTPVVDLTTKIEILIHDVLKDIGPDAHHSATWDASTTWQGTGVASLGGTHTPVGTPTAAVATLYHWTAGVPATITYGGTSMGAVPAATAVDGLGTCGSIYGLANPASGAQTFNITWGGARDVVATITTVTGSDTTTCFSSVDALAGDSAAPSLTISSAADELVIAGGGTDGGSSITEGAGQTSRGSGSAGGIRFRCTTEAGAASVVSDFTTGVSSPWVVTAGSVKAAVSKLAAITGTATTGINEGNLVAGSKQIVVTLTGETWIQP